MQLDIFEHSREVMLRNDILDALHRCDATTARNAWETLRQEFAQDETLVPLAVLIDALAAPAQAAFPDHASARHARLLLTRQIEPAAVRLFGGEAAAKWLVPMWGRMAERAAQLPFRAEHGDEHAAALWLQARNWPAAAEAATGVESWRRIPAPLSWLAEARYRIDGLDAVWALLAERRGKRRALARPLDRKVRLGEGCSVPGDIRAPRKEAETFEGQRGLRAKQDTACEIARRASAWSSFTRSNRRSR